MKLWQRLRRMGRLRKGIGCIVIGLQEPQAAEFILACGIACNPQTFSDSCRSHEMWMNRSYIPSNYFLIGQFQYD